MTDKELRELLLDYTSQGAERQTIVKNQVMSRLPKRTKSHFRVYIQRIAAAAAACIILFSILVFASPDSALAATVKDQIINVIEKLFPPTEIRVTPEGEAEEVLHMPHTPQMETQEDEIPKSRETETSGPGLQAEESPQFVIYVDDSSYSFHGQNGIFEITPLSVNESIPECKITISLLENISMEEAAANCQSGLKDTYGDVSEVSDSQLLNGLYISANDGSAWDSRICDIHIVDDSQGGVFLISSQYFMEAAEGHGTRFDAMIATFEVISPQGLPTE